MARSLIGRAVSAMLVLLLIAALVAGATGMLLDNTFEVRVSADIEAPMDAIHPFVASPRQHTAWMGWDDDQDPSLRRTYVGPAEGRGAGVRWRGEGFGTGSLRIERASLEEGVQWRQELPGGVSSSGMLRYEAVEGGRTRVTWTERGVLPRPHGPFFAGMLEQTLARHATRALDFLAAAAEGRPPPRDARAP